VDSVHQGDLEGEKGVYHINAVDEVTQWQVVGAVSQISEAALEPVLESMLDEFPFLIRGFHSDSGSEYHEFGASRAVQPLRSRGSMNESWEKLRVRMHSPGQPAYVARGHVGGIGVVRPQNPDSKTAARREVDHMFSLTYEELRRLATVVRKDDPSATLSPTALVHEAWMKMARSMELTGLTKLEFKRIAARAMRQLLVEAARRRQARKRGGGGAILVTLEDSSNQAVAREDQLIALDTALDDLARANPRQALMIEVRFFGGLKVPEAAELLGVSESTVHREWKFARAWLSRELRRAG